MGTQSSILKKSSKRGKKQDREYHDIKYKKNSLACVNSRHAEMALLKKCPKNILGDCVMVCVRINSQGLLMKSDPCDNCSSVLKRKNITVYHS